MFEPRDSLYKEKEIWSKRLLLILSLFMSLKPEVLKSHPQLFGRLMKICGNLLKKSSEIENYPELRPILNEIRQLITVYF